MPLKHPEPRDQAVGGCPLGVGLALSIALSSPESQQRQGVLGVQAEVAPELGLACQMAKGQGDPQGREREREKGIPSRSRGEVYTEYE